MPLVPQLLKIFALFMKPKSSLKRLEESITSPHSEQNEANPHHPTLFFVYPVSYPSTYA
jgi:hypothetical protein